MPKNLQLALKAEYFDAIKSGEKLEEFRLRTPYWEKRLIDTDGSPAQFDTITLTKGYPKSGDPERTLVLPYIGWRRITLKHKHFGDNPVDVFAINVSKNAELPTTWLDQYPD